MSVRREIWKDGEKHMVYRDEKGMFSKAHMENVEVVDWLTQNWSNRKLKPFHLTIKKMFK